MKSNGGPEACIHAPRSQGGKPTDLRHPGRLQETQRFGINEETKAHTCGCYGFCPCFAAHSSLVLTSFGLGLQKTRFCRSRLWPTRRGLTLSKRWPEAFGLQTLLNHSAAIGSGSAAAGHAGWLVTGHWICAGTEAWPPRLRPRKFPISSCSLEPLQPSPCFLKPSSQYL